MLQPDRSNLNMNTSSSALSPSSVIAAQPWTKLGNTTLCILVVNLHTSVVLMSLCTWTRRLVLHFNTLLPTSCLWHLDYFFFCTICATHVKWSMCCTWVLINGNKQLNLRPASRSYFCWNVTKLVSGVMPIILPVWQLYTSIFGCLFHKIGQPIVFGPLLVVVLSSCCQTKLCPSSTLFCDVHPSLNAHFPPTVEKQDIRRLWAFKLKKNSALFCSYRAEKWMENQLCL